MSDGENKQGAESDSEQLFDPLLIDEDEAWLTQAAEAAFTEIFKRFDVDNDGLLSFQEIQAFALAANGKKFTAKELRELRDGELLDAQGKWTLHGFLSFFHLQTSSHVCAPPCWSLVAHRSDLARRNVERSHQVWL